MLANPAELVDLAFGVNYKYFNRQNLAQLDVIIFASECFKMKFYDELDLLH